MPGETAMVIDRPAINALNSSVMDSSMYVFFSTLLVEMAEPCDRITVLSIRFISSVFLFNEILRFIIPDLRALRVHMVVKFPIFKTGFPNHRQIVYPCARCTER